MTRKQIYHNNRVVGILDGDTYRQQFTAEHVYRQLNARGMSLDVYETLKNLGCHFWLIQNPQTKQGYTMPFYKIKIVATEVKTKTDGIQLMVNFADFNMKHPEIQKPMI